MARPVATDFYQNFRFHIIALDEAGKEELIKNINIVPGVPDAGFATSTIPELSIGIAEYRDGITTYTKKQPGIPSFTEITLTRGLMKRDTGLFKWAIKSLTGDEYRIDLAILQFHRTDATQPSDKRNPSRRIIVRNAFPSRFRPGSDLDATSEDVTVQELDIAFESYYIIADGEVVGNDII